MSRILIAFLLLVSSPAFADEPVPTPVDDLTAFVAGKGVEGDGKRNTPFQFDATTVCMLRLTGKSSSFVFDVDDAPTNIIAIDRTLVFSLAESGTFQVIAHGEGCYARCWFQIKSGTDPPKPEDSITSRVKAAMAGQPADAKAFASAADELAKAMDAGTINSIATFHGSMKVGLAAVNWPVGKYPDMSKLSGELFGGSVGGPGVPDEQLSPEKRATFVKSLRALSKACGEIK